MHIHVHVCDISSLLCPAGKMLLQWLSSAFDEAHYLYSKLSRYDLKVMTTQFCTHLVAARVIKQLDDREGEGPLFKVSVRK